MKLIREIKNRKGELHFKRWQILTTPWFSIYIHGIYKRDMQTHLHDHPWNLWTMVIWGSYVEELLSKDKKSTKLSVREFGNMAYRNTTRFHKIKSLVSEKVFTLAIVGNRIREWGYHTEKGWIDQKSYKDKERV